MIIEMTPEQNQALAIFGTQLDRMVRIDLTSNIIIDDPIGYRLLRTAITERILLLQMYGLGGVAMEIIDARREAFKRERGQQ